MLDYYIACYIRISLVNPCVFMISHKICALFDVFSSQVIMKAEYVYMLENVGHQKIVVFITRKRLNNYCLKIL